MHPVTTILGGRARANRACRAPTKLTLAELAAVLHVRQTTISNWESGTTEPTLAEIYAYASACGATARLDVFRETAADARQALLSSLHDLPGDDVAMLMQIAAAFRDIKPRTKAVLTAAIVGAAADARE